jgi:eukaryotic-like serine/threonine-protein kinase
VITACPSPDDLVQLLECTLGQTVRVGVLAHVETCVLCQSDLDGLTAAPTALLARKDFDSEDLVTATVTLPAASAAAGNGPGSSSERFALTRLAGARAPRVSHAPSGYEIYEEIGRGGMGIVYRARHLGLLRSVALKMLLGETHRDTSRLARFRVEAEAVAKLRHPNIVQVFDVGESAGRPFLALELLEGGTLADRLAEKMLPISNAAELVLRLSGALEAAHKAGIVHRDLKPSNVLFTIEGVPKLADFGLARLLEDDDGPTLTGQVMGSPSYMAPEQARGDGHSAGPPADIYALGAILYELLTGRPPFKSPTVMGTVHQVVHDDPVPPSRLQARVPRDLETICLKCLEKEPGRRYGSASALAKDLRSFVENRPIRARRISPWERISKWARRRPAEAGMIASAAAAVVTIVASAFWYYDVQHRQELRDARRLADQQRETSERERRETERLHRTRREVTRDLLSAQEKVARGDWSDGRLVLSNVITRTREEPRLADLRDQAARMLGRAEKALADRELEAAARREYERFMSHFKEALFRETRVAGLGLADDPAGTIRALRAALAVFPGTPPVLPEFLSERERAEINDGCYTLYVVLAGVEKDPNDGLKALERAASIRPSTRAFHLRRAACLLALGNDDEAGIESVLAAKLEPKTALDHFLTGRERMQAKRWDEARRRFELALQSQPDHFWSEFLLALCYLQLERPVEARASLNACLRAQPEVPWLHLMRAVASGNIAAANLRAAGLDVANAKEPFDDAEASYSRALELLDASPVPSADLRYIVLVNRGVMRFHRGNARASSADLSAAIKLAPDLSQAYAELGTVLARTGLSAMAAERFGEAIARNPQSATLYRARADIVLLQKDPNFEQIESALRDLSMALRFERSSSALRARDFANQAWLLERSGQLTAALAANDLALTAQPDYAAALHQKINVLIRLKRLDEAEHACGSALARGAHAAWLYKFRGLTRELKNDHAGAVADFTEAIRQSPDDQDLRTRRGWAYLASGAEKLALLDFDRAVQLDQSNADAYAGRGLARAALGMAREAADDAEQSLRKGGTEPRRLFGAARTYAMAAPALASEVGKNGRSSTALAERFEDRAVTLLNDSLSRQPSSAREAFIREMIAPDPVLNRFRRRIRISSTTTKAGIAEERTPALAQGITP